MIGPSAPGDPTVLESCYHYDNKQRLQIVEVISHMVSPRRANCLQDKMFNSVSFRDADMQIL